MTELAVILALPLLLVCVGVLPYLRVGVDLADEGYLVYGTACLMKGQVPIRDFRAYDPARYYWMVPFAKIFGATFRAIRIGNATLLFLTLVIMSAVVLQATQSAVVTAATCVLVFFWLQPRHKQIDNALTILGLAALAQIGPEATVLHFGLMGAVLGIALFAGLNHFVYIGGAFILVLILRFAMPSPSALGGFVVGLSLSALPVIWLWVMVPGYRSAYLPQKVVRLAKRGTTNLNLPHPWLWTPKDLGFRNLDMPRRWVAKALFTLMPLTFIAGLSATATAASVVGPDAAHLAVAASALGLTTFYHTLSRADLGHLFMPALSFLALSAVTLHAIFGAAVTGLILAVAVVASVWLVWQQIHHAPGYQRTRGRLEEFRAPQEVLVVPKGLGRSLERWRDLMQQHTSSGETILAVPVHVGLCALFERPHAVFDTFPVYPSSVLVRDQMLIDFEATQPKLLIVGSIALDQREDLVFLNNYPNLAQHINAHYDLLEDLGQSRVFLRRVTSSDKVLGPNETGE